MKAAAFLETKAREYYKGIPIMADTGLHDQIAEVIQSVLPKGARILDSGAGAGALSQRLQDLGYAVYSVDKNHACFKADTCFEQIDLDDADQLSAFMMAHAESFELVLAVEVIEHVENPWKYIRDLKSLVRPGGYILLSTPNVASWYSRVLFFFTGRLHQFGDGDRHYGHINPIFEDELRLIAQRTDLQIVCVRPGGWLPRLWLSWRPSVMLRHLFGFVGSLFMLGTYEGWCLIVLMRRPEATAKGIGWSGPSRDGADARTGRVGSSDADSVRGRRGAHRVCGDA